MSKRTKNKVMRCGKITIVTLCLMLAVGFGFLTAFWPIQKANAADITKSQGELYAWTLLDDTAGVPYLETGVHTYTDTLSSVLNVAMVNVGAVADAGSVGFKIFVRYGAADDGWREWINLQADVAVAVTIDVDAEAASAQAVIPLSATTNFDEPAQIGKTFFLRDATLANSELVIWGGVFENDVSITVIDNLVRTHADTADIYQVVKQWNIRLPNGNDEAKVVFYNQDADANYACRVDYANEDDIE